MNTNVNKASAQGGNEDGAEVVIICPREQLGGRKEGQIKAVKKQKQGMKL